MKRIQVHSVVLYACVVACLVFIYACAGIAAVWNTASEHVIQIGIGGAVGLAVGAATGGISLLPIVAASIAAATATLLATPPCAPLIVQGPPNPLSAAIHWIFIALGVWFLFRNREHILNAVKGRSLYPLIHSLVGGAFGRSKDKAS